MPKNQTLLQVFVASPGDVAEEREILESVIDEINQTSAKISNIRLELIKWETHSRPGFGEDAQDVINQQIGDDYDIFLGIMWGRFGSPTQRAGSGTEEEFDRALARWKASPGSVEIMFYFKNAGIPPNEIEPEQLAKVQAFKDRISSEGGLYHESEDAEQFRTKVRGDLNGVIQDWRGKDLPNSETAKATAVQGAPSALDAASEALLADTGYSSDATAVARLFVERSEHGLFADPQFRVGELAQETGLSIEDTEDALYELSDFVGMSDERGEISQKSVFAKGACFAEFDRFWKPWNPADDARKLASDLVYDPAFPPASAEITKRYGWKPRRLNPAISYLLDRELILNLQVMGTHPYAVAEIVQNNQTRRFVKGRM